MPKKIIIGSERTETYIDRSLITTRDVKEAAEILRGKFGSYPLYAFFLYSEFDEDLAEFMRLRGQWLHSLSGEDCLIGVLENPGEWGEGWERYWQKRLGSDFSQISAEWMKLKPFDRNTAFSIADLLEVEKNTLPCIVFVESFSQKEAMCIPIIPDKNYYPRYFQDIFTAVHSATKAPAGARLQALRSQWRKVWAEWILPKKIAPPRWLKDMGKSIQEWGSLIKETKDAIVKAIDPLTPILRQVKALIS